MSKFKVIKKHRVPGTDDEMPKHFLADTIEEAEAVYHQFSDMLNKIAAAYQASTGLEKSDLFAEALIALAEAKRDFQIERSENFECYASFRIRDALNEYVRKNIYSVIVPSYIRKAAHLLSKLNTVLNSKGVDSAKTIIKNGTLVSAGVPKEILVDCEYLLEKLHNAAERAGITYTELHDRVVLVPYTGEFEDQTSVETEEEVVESILVSQLLDQMDKEERTIAEGIMADKSFDVIAGELGRSRAWVYQRFNKFRKRIFDLMKEEMNM